MMNKVSISTRHPAPTDNCGNLYQNTDDEDIYMLIQADADHLQLVSLGSGNRWGPKSKDDPLLSCRKSFKLLRSDTAVTIIPGDG